MKIYWWDSDGYGTWVFVLAESEEQARALIRVLAPAKDKESNPNDPKYDYWQKEAEYLLKLNSLDVIESGRVVWGEFA